MKAERYVDAGFVQIAIVDVDTLVRNWGVVLLRGLAGIIFGLVTFLAPDISLTVLVLVFGAYALVDGVLAIVSAIRWRAEVDRWWVLLLEGLAGVAAGIVTFVWPGISALALLYVIAAWALVTGVLEIAAAIRLRKIITGEWLLALIGVASVALGIMLAFFRPRRAGAGYLDRRDRHGRTAGRACVLPALVGQVPWLTTDGAWRGVSSAPRGARGDSPPEKLIRVR